MRESWRTFLCLVLGSTGLALAVPGAADTKDPLPDPLTLEQALQLADDSHPEIGINAAALAHSVAVQRGVESRNDFLAHAEARAIYAEPASNSTDQSNDDHALQLFVRKPLYDFGHTQALREAVDAGVAGGKLRVLDARHQQQLTILAAFFDVILADLRFARENEAMAIAFIRADRAATRNELDQVSDIQRLELQSAYQEVRRARYAAAAAQRAARGRLAAALNRPDQLSAQVTVPRFSLASRERPEFEKLLATALTDNPMLAARRAEMESARKRVQAERASTNPTLSMQARAGAFSRKSGSSRDPFRAGLVLEVPIYSGGRADARVARYRAEFARLGAVLAREELAMREALLEAWLAVEALSAARDDAVAFADYRDLYLDRARARYEQDIRADLGDSMVQVSEGRLRRAAADFELATAWARIHALTGRPPDTLYAWLTGEIE